MKRILFVVFCLSASILSFGQNKEALSRFNDINFYGVDFTVAKTFAVEENIEQVKTCFKGINTLFLTEVKKYDIRKYFKKNVLKTSISEADILNNNITADKLFDNNANYEINANELASHIKSLPVDGDGVGLIFVAELLNKAQNKGTFHIVFFDIKTKEIIESWKAKGRAKGFGLRNFWAGSIYDIIKSVKIK
jgi:hypothetical protein